MTSSIQVIVFLIEGQRYALALDSVERVVHSVEVSLLPKAPDTILGIINLQGRIVPVVDMRKRFGLPSRQLELSDQFIICRTQRRTVTLVADVVSGLIEVSMADFMEAETILPDMQHLRGVIKLQEGLVFVNDLDQFLSLEEERTLETALEQKAAS